VRCVRTYSHGPPGRNLAQTHTFGHDSGGGLVRFWSALTPLRAMSFARAPTLRSRAAGLQPSRSPQGCGFVVFAHIVAQYELRPKAQDLLHKCWSYRPAAARSAWALSVRWLRPGLAALHIGCADMSLRRKPAKFAVLRALQARCRAQRGSLVFWSALTPLRAMSFARTPTLRSRAAGLQPGRSPQDCGFVGALASAGPCGPSHRLRRYEPAPKASQVRCAQGLTGPLPRAAWQPCLSFPT